MTKTQEKDLETVRYFIPPQYKTTPITSDDIQMFFDWSERGLHKDKIKLSHFSDGFNVLVSGKSRRGLHMRMWEDGVLDGSVPYYELLGGNGEVPPRAVVDFMKKELFRGIDAELIENLYTQINEKNLS